MSTHAQQETLSFQAEVKQLLHLVTHSLYSNKEIFLRELISNASDAADKLRFESLNDSALYENDSELKIEIDFDAQAKTITIRDNGIGMNREEVIENLGTIAKSGTQEFLKRISGDQAKDSQLIGQFGVGFYSAFVVADKVTVKTRRAGMKTDQGVYWESQGEGDYTIKNIDYEPRGTEIILHVREEAAEFLDYWRLKNIVVSYSDHIMLPIFMKAPEMFTGEETAEQKKEPAKPEQVNRATALWTLPKSQITDEQYIELYKHISHDFEAPLVWAHNKVEGKLEYTSLLYIPSTAPYDLWDRNHRQGLKLFVRRVYIMDDAKEFLPGYLRFVRGVVDSNDLPLNISRELLQSHQVIDSIRSACIKRVLDMLEDTAKNDPEKYNKFWKIFGVVLKEGPGEDYSNRERIAKLLRFNSTRSEEAAGQGISLEDYLGRMVEGQDKIYYITADSYTAAKNSPHLEIFRKKGIEVLILSDRVDEWLVSNLTEFEGKALQSVAKGGLDLGVLEDTATKEKTIQAATELSDILTRIKKILGEKIKEARITDRLVDSPACLVSDEKEMSLHLQNLLKSAGQSISNTQPILELNADHPIIAKMKAEIDDERFANWTELLFEQAQLAQGTVLEDPGGFVKRLNSLLLDVSK